MSLRSMFKAAGATAAFALFHSGLASFAVKDAVERGVGTRVRNGLYRPLYNLASVLAFGALVAYVRNLPGRPVYQVRGPAAGLMRVGQAAGLCYAIAAVREVGLAKFAGLPGLLALAAGRKDVPAEPEAQGPPVDERTAGVGASGPFATSRQPLNFVLLPLLWLNPRMTPGLASFSLVTTLYSYLGSLHSERRLRVRYGREYEAYRRSGVPFLVPSPHRALR